jgi:hypothetical protein
VPGKDGTSSKLAKQDALWSRYRAGMEWRLVVAIVASVLTVVLTAVIVLVK